MSLESFPPSTCSELCVQHVFFLSDIRENGMIAVKLFIGTADTLFVAFGILSLFLQKQIFLSIFPTSAIPPMLFTLSVVVFMK